MLWTDGGSRGSPAHPPRAAIGFVLCAADGAELARHAEAIGVAGAAVAEYHALAAGLRRALDLGVERLDARCDSRLVVDHLAGARRPHNPALAALGEEIADLARRIGTVTYTWIPADGNGQAHALVAGVLGR